MEVKPFLERPVKLWLQATNTCNQNCTWCYGVCTREPEPGEWTTQELLDFIDYLVNRIQSSTFIGYPLFRTADDPSSPGTVLGVKIRGWGHWVFVLAPEGAATVRLVGPDGTILDESTVTQRGIMLAMPGSTTVNGERVEAIDTFPLTRVGKVDKAALRQRIADTLAAEQAEGH